MNSRAWSWRGWQVNRVERAGKLFESELVVANVGSSLFADSLRMQGKAVIHIDWRVPCGGDERLYSVLTRIRSGAIDVEGRPVPAARLIEEANARALEIINTSHPFIVGIGTAIRDIPGMQDNLILHAGPPVTWDRMCGPMKGAVMGALIYEGKAKNGAEAAKLAASGEIDFEPCHHHAAVGPMAGVVSPSMPVWIVENRQHGNRAYCTLNEGLGKVLRYGAYSDEVVRRLRYIERTLAPVLSRALMMHGEVDLRALIAQALQMGDEGHNRNKAGTSLLIRELAPSIVRADASDKDKTGVLEFMHDNDHFFLNLTMPAGKCALDPVMNIKGCTVVTAMARNGTDFGIRVSGLGERWFTAPAPRVQGLYFTGYGDDDANPDIGDSTICETYGIGGFAMAAAPAIVEFVGGTPADANRFTLAMYDITVGESRNFRIPAMGFRGTPTGIDILKVVERRIVPAVNTGIAHREPGVGQVGAGLVEPPISVFEEALEAVYDAFEVKP
jgi:hypothetical protein